jgi:hypothetical protein
MQMKRGWILLVFVAVFVFFSSNALCGLYTLNPTDDTYVSSISKGTNYAGTPPDSYNFKFSNSGGPYQAYMKFSLSSIPEDERITNLTLSVRTESTTLTTTGYTFKVYYVPISSWIETTLTWNNKPSYSTELASAVLGGVPGNPSWSWDRSKWNVDADQTNDVLSLAISGDQTPTTSSYTARSSEFTNSSNWPSLVITTEERPSPVPIPAAVWLFGTGLLALFGVRRKIRK